MKMRTKILLSAAILTFLICITASAQPASDRNIIRGTILDASNREPVAYAHIAVMDSDSLFIGGTSSDPEGHFILTTLPAEKGLLAVSYVGYDIRWIPLPTITGESLPEILLEPSSVALEEVIVQAHDILIKEDRKMLFPSQDQVKLAVDGSDLIRRMQLPRIVIDPSSGEIALSGKGEIQLRINGIEVTYTEIASIPPADILRIDYYDAPGARYGNAEIVIDYITRRKELGVNISGTFFNSIGGDRTSADDRLALKLNRKNSELSANTFFIQRKQNWIRDYDETLIFPEKRIHRLEKGEPTLFNKKVFSSNLNYSLLQEGNYFFNAQLRYITNQFPNGFEDRRTTLYTSDTEIPLAIYDHTREKSHSPALDLYYQHTLQKINF